MRATASSEGGGETVSESSFRTLKPSKEQTETVTVLLPADGTTVGVGVGQPLSLTFDHAVKSWPRWTSPGTG
ncbi:Ig-like domain-containing protein [Streptomyces sp. 4.24]|uniref:Ig-like domain-containing protein n=1 Tax=Streptomyces tritrimontium TaxID=3406573 RepID=UPI003BB5EEAA